MASPSSPRAGRPQQQRQRIDVERGVDVLSLHKPASASVVEERVQRVLTHLSATSSLSTPSPSPSPSPAPAPAPARTAMIAASAASSTTSSATSSASIHASSSALAVRPLRADDDAKGFLSLLAQLTDVGDIDHERFLQRFQQIEALHSTHRVCVIEDTSARKVVATATLIVEYKFIHNISQIGHVEDVVVSSEYRGQNLGAKIVQHLIDLARSLGCYKVILDCDDRNHAFYQRFGFREHQRHMALYFAEHDKQKS